MHIRLMDVVHGPAAAVPLATAHYPRDTIAGDTRPVLAPIVLVGGAARVEHARIAIDIPRDAALDFSYGARGRGAAAPPAGTVVQFRIELVTPGGTQVILDESAVPASNGPIHWTRVTRPLPAATGATLVFSTSVPPKLAGAVLPHFAAPVVTVPIHQTRPRSVVLISLDTLRADHLGIYGYRRATSPRMDALFGREGVVVDRTYSQAANTPGGHIAMLKGVWPTTGFKPSPFRLWQSEGVLSLSEVLRVRGYRVAAFTEDALLDGPAGFNRGFDDGYYEELEVQGRAKGHIEQTFDRGLDWLRAHPDDPVFLFLHTYQVHHPYTPPPHYAARFPSAADATAPARDINAYDAEIVYTDEQMARLVSAIDALGRRDDTLLIVTSDHGEEFGEHGRRQHGSNATNEILHVPMLLRAPGLLPAGVRRDGPMALMDLPSTVLDLLGYDAPESMRGRSLAAHLRDAAVVDIQPIFSEAAGAIAETYGGLDPWIPPSFAVTQWPWRMVRIRTDKEKGVRYDLYDLARDPGETKNLFAERGADMDALRVAVDLYEYTALAEQAAIERRMIRAASGAAPVSEPDPAREEKMRALGYIQ